MNSEVLKQTVKILFWLVFVFLPLKPTSIPSSHSSEAVLTSTTPNTDGACEGQGGFGVGAGESISVNGLTGVPSFRTATLLARVFLESALG